MASCLRRQASRLVLYTGVIPGIAHDKQREFASDQVKKGAHARRFTRQPVRHWDHWLHENTDLANTHFIAYDGEGRNRVDLTPDAKREFAIDPMFDLSNDGSQLAVIRQSTGADRVLDTTILLIDIASNKQTQFGTGNNVNYEPVRISPDGRTLATIRSVRSSQTVMRPRLTLIDIASGSERTLAEDWDRWPQLEAWTIDGKRVIVSADDNGDTPLFAIDVSIRQGGTNHRGSGRWRSYQYRSAAGRTSGLHPFDAARCSGMFRRRRNSRLHAAATGATIRI